jgi:hypothetical protein
MIETRDIHWLAGWLEGEASFSIYNTVGKPYLEFTVQAYSGPKRICTSKVK